MDTDGSQRKALRDATPLFGIGGDLIKSYTELIYKKEPDDLVGKIFYWAGMISQLIISIFTFPVALAAFLLEEAAQSLSMGSYLLFTSKDWESLNMYMYDLQPQLNTFESIARAMAVLNPVTAGAVIIYLQSAKKSAAATGQAMLYQVQKLAKTYDIPNVYQKDVSELLSLIRIAESDKAAKEVQDAQTYGTLAVKSTPTYADIYIDGGSTELQTPETFKNMTEGTHEIAVGKYNTKTQTYDTYATTIEIVAGRKKEITLHLTGGTQDDLVEPTSETEDETPQLPPFIKTTVTVAKMVDGDTFETVTGERIRILGMDAPEKGQPISNESIEFMAGKLVDHKVDVKIQTHLPVDTYGRTLAIVTYRDENVAVSSIANGLAKAYILPDATYDPTRYQEAEQIAKTRKLGIWNPDTPPIIWRGT